jgi:Ca2+-binding EF-hand superfamily protein
MCLLFLLRNIEERHGPGQTAAAVGQVVDVPVIPRLGRSAHILEVPDRAKRHEMFRQMDFNGNGVLSLAEIDKAIVESYPQYHHKPALMRAYKAADKNDDGYIKDNEFHKLLHYLVYFNNLWHKFEEIDVDGDGRLDIHEFVSGCRRVGVDLGPDPSSEFSVICESEGHVLFGEFCTWCAKKHVGGLSAAEEQRVAVTSPPKLVSTAPEGIPPRR